VKFVFDFIGACWQEWGGETTPKSIAHNKLGFTTVKDTRKWYFILGVALDEEFFSQMDRPTDG